MSECRAQSGWGSSLPDVDIPELLGTDGGDGEDDAGGEGGEDGDNDDEPLRVSWTVAERREVSASLARATFLRSINEYDGVDDDVSAPELVVVQPCLMLSGNTQHVLGVLASDAIIMDGGATIFATPDDSYCFEIVPCAVTIAGVGGVAFTCRRKGSLLFQSASRKLPITLTNVHIAAEFPATFLSESLLVRKGCTITKSAAGGTVVSAELGHLCNLEERDGLFYAVGHLVRPPERVLVQAKVVRFDTPPSDDDSPPQSCRGGDFPEMPFLCNDNRAALSWLVKCDLRDDCVISSGVVGNPLLLAKTYTKHEMSDLLGRYHRRMSHMDFKRVAAAYGIVLPAGFEPPLCHSCVIGKQRNVPHHEGARLRAVRACAGLHIDFCGPFPHTSRYGARYLLIFKCDFTGFIWDFYPQSQSDFFDIFVALLARLSNQFSVKNVVFLGSQR